MKRHKVFEFKVLNYSPEVHINFLRGKLESSFAFWKFN